MEQKRVGICDNLEMLKKCYDILDETGQELFVLVKALRARIDTMKFVNEVCNRITIKLVQAGIYHV